MLGAGSLIAALALTYEPPKGDVVVATKDENSNVETAATTGDGSEKKQPADKKETAADKVERKGLDKGSDKPKQKVDPSNDQKETATAATKNEAVKSNETKETAAIKVKQPKPVVDKSKQKKKVTASDALVAAPVMALHKKSRKGLLPRVAKDGRRPMDVYAAKPGKTQGPVIAIVLTNLGHQRLATTSATRDLPSSVTLAFSPYADELQTKVDAARARGHEVLVELPMEPQTFPKDDPGPLALLTGLPVRINVERLEWVLGKFAGHVGVMATMGDRFGDSEPAVRPILQRLQDAGLMYVDNRLATSNIPLSLADDLGLPRVYVDRTIDWRPTRTDIENRLAELEKIAKAQGVAVGLGQPYPVTIERLIVWTQRLANNGVALVPVSAIAGKQPAVK